MVAMAVASFAWLVLCIARGVDAAAIITSSATAPIIVPGVSAIADRFDAFLLDQFGVLHDGKAALPGAVNCFDQLTAAGKRCVILSNTSRRRAHALSKLPSLGFDADALWRCFSLQCCSHCCSGCCSGWS